MKKKYTLLKLAEVMEKTLLRKSSIYLKMKEGTFPKPINLTSRSIAWVEDDIDKWIENLIKQSRK